ncbi:calcitonin gene-related peptide type 1 receptor [Anopheles bellator]|uniref:calcitonin gene-related peptide type 1 receptor n=1 Tax=Anopheles bellator TaxID=139047 RepID=UPI002648BC59|nr:calcitonin gene-related peptide type 1 receptor [Anopheles bellator]
MAQPADCPPTVFGCPQPIRARATNRHFSRTTMLAVGEQDGAEGQGGQIQFDRLEFGSPEELMHHLYYSCMRANATDPAVDGTKAYCPRRFDGWSCWEPTVAGTVAENFCPNFILGFDSGRLAHRTCNENGSWFVHPQSGREWSNYTNCIDTDDMQLRRLVNEIYISGYMVSFLTLIISLCIFHSFRTLKCTRIRIHINLFTSLALSCLFWIVWYKFVVEDPDVLKANSSWCIGLHVLLHYLMLVNYLWMFCEGLHLHLVLVIVFIKDIVALRWFVTIGWLLPVLLVSLYAIVRHSMPLDTDHCWMDESHAMWLLTVPVCCSLLASLVFLINVVRVLLTKLNSTSPNPAPLGLRKATRATLILIPLFGLQHILLPFRPDKGCQLERYYQIGAALLISLQGLCVSCLFCFANHDVIFAVQCYLNRFFPDVVTHPFLESGQPATQSRDVAV